MNSRNDRNCFVYILTNRAGMFYIGVTSDLERRIAEHRQGALPEFASHYGLTKLVYYEDGGSPEGAIAREKQLKGWSRAKKAALVESANPGWRDLGADLIGGDPHFDANELRLRKPLPERSKWAAKFGVERPDSEPPKGG